jgi:hypothetical protein
MTRLVQGHGINDMTVKINGVLLPSYRSWSRILERVYSKSYHNRNPTYKECTVHEEWLLLSNYDKWYNKNYIEGYHLDKDILVPNNKHYAPNTCRFIPKNINTLLVDNKGKRGKYKKGIVGKQGNKFRVECAVYGETKRLGSFDNEQTALAAYKTFKEKHVKEVAIAYYGRGEIPNDIYQALMEWTIPEE